LCVNVKTEFDEQGGFFMKGKLAILTLGVSIGYALTGCATISKDSCLQDSWYDVGFKGASQNKDLADHISDVTKICGKLGVSVDMPLYTKGFDEGTRQFCDPDNGYQWGLKGRSYNGICANPRFSAAYVDGYRIYTIEQRRSAITSRLSSIRDRLAAIDKALDEKTLTEEQKRKLTREFDKLLLERSDLLSEQRSLPPV
jgi:hypothetical protein